MARTISWVVPEGDTKTVGYAENEWKVKGETVVNLCKSKNTVVQAGGNIGIFPYYLSKYFKEVITFEPVPKNITCLYNNTKYISNIQAIEKGLGDKCFSAEIIKEQKGNSGAIQLEYCSYSKIKIIPLDSIKLTNLDLLWLDLEGFEARALIGAFTHIEKFKPVIVIENNGLVIEFPSDKNGSVRLRKWMKFMFNYTFHARMMRDDLFLPV